MSSVRELAGKRGASIEPNLSMLKHRDSLWQHMYEISGDPSGSKPEDYFNQQDQEAIAEFFELATELDYVDAEPIIDMRRSWLPGLDGFPNSRRVHKAGLASLDLLEPSSFLVWGLPGRLCFWRTKYDTNSASSTLYERPLTAFTPWSRTY